MNDNAMQELSLQERFAPSNKCFGCGPANTLGLRIRSCPTSDSPESDVVLNWQPKDQYEAFDNILNGGIIGTLMDCHSNWTAVWHLMCRDGLEEAPATVTADFHVKLRHPTPTDRPLSISARATTSSGSRVEVEAVLRSGEQITATCTGNFVAVPPGHPAHRRW